MEHEAVAEVLGVGATPSRGTNVGKWPQTLKIMLYSAHQDESGMKAERKATEVLKA